MVITPVTELDAVNEIIGSIGETPVNTLEDVTSVDVVNAKRILATVTRDILVMGWTFNRVDEYMMNPDSNTHKIPWNEEILYIRGLDGQIYRNKGGFVFSMQENTDEFTKPLYVSVYLNVPFNEMPEVFRNYVTARASRMFQERYLGDELSGSWLRQAEQEAWAVLMDHEHTLERNDLTMNVGIMELMRR